MRGRAKINLGVNFQLFAAMAEDAAGDVPAAKRRCTGQMKVSLVSPPTFLSETILSCPAGPCHWRNWPSW